MKGEKTDVENKISVVLVRTGKYPIHLKIANTEERIRELIGGGEPEAIPMDDGAILLCDEERELKELPMNRALMPEPSLKDIIRGDFLISYISPETGSFCSLPYDLEEKYLNKFRSPQHIFIGESAILVMDYKPVRKE